MLQPMNDIQTKDDIKRLVDAFYSRVKKDELLGPVFHEKIKDWGPHLELMYDFWNTVLFGKSGYRGNPFSKHITLPVKAEHFARWVKLFHETLDALFEGIVANNAKSKASKISLLFQHKLNELQSAKKDLPVS